MRKVERNRQAHLYVSKGEKESDTAPFQGFSVPGSCQEWVDVTDKHGFNASKALKNPVANLFCGSGRMFDDPLAEKMVPVGYALSAKRGECWAFLPHPAHLGPGKIRRRGNTMAYPILTKSASASRARFNRIRW